VSASPHEERRPAQSAVRTSPDPLPILAASGGPVLIATEADATGAPCRRCGHALSAPRSVARGIGPVCLHLVAGEAR